MLIEVTQSPNLHLQIAFFGAINSSKLNKSIFTVINDKERQQIVTFLDATCKNISRKQKKQKKTKNTSCELYYRHI